jgi:hypothetical protein
MIASFKRPPCLCKRCFDQAGWFDTKFDISEDYDMFLRLARNFHIVGLGEPLVGTRASAEHGEQHSQVVRVAPGPHAQAFWRSTAKYSRNDRAAAAGTCLAYRAVAIKCLQDGTDDQGWQYLRQGAIIWPEILSQAGTLYELVCGNQPPGLRGDARHMNLPQRESYMRQHLDELFRQADTALVSQRNRAYGNTYLTLGMLGDQAGDQSAARHYLWTALRYQPTFLIDYPFMRRLIKVSAGLKRRPAIAS